LECYDRQRGGKPCIIFYQRQPNKERNMSTPGGGFGYFSLQDAIANQERQHELASLAFKDRMHALQGLIGKLSADEAEALIATIQGIGIAQSPEIGAYLAGTFCIELTQRIAQLKNLCPACMEEHKEVTVPDDFVTEVNGNVEDDMSVVSAMAALNLKPEPTDGRPEGVACRSCNYHFESVEDFLAGPTAPKCPSCLHKSAHG
jgi:hypothetical protein